MDARFPREDMAARRRMMLASAGLAATSAIVTSAILGGALPAEWSTFVILVGFLFGCGAGAFLVPFLAETLTGSFVAHRRAVAGLRLRELVRRTQQGDPDAGSMLQACAAYLATRDLAHVRPTARIAAIGLGAVDSLGSVAGLAWGVLNDPAGVRPDDVNEVLDVAAVAETDPNFRLVLPLVDASLTAYARAARAARSCSDARRAASGAQILAGLAPDWSGDLDELDAAVALLAGPVDGSTELPTS